MGSQNAKVEEIQKKVLGTIKKHNLVKPGESILVGVSGGPDSVCLLHILYSLRHISCEFDTNQITAIHINHMLRGNESDMDEKYVNDLCRLMGINLYTERLNVREISAKRGISIEEAARNARYAQFALLAEKIGNCKIAVAHNRNDQAETVIMNIMRGTGLEGLKGMEHERGKIIRPMLDIGRGEIEEYCKIAGLKPRIDSSNLENIYTRNKVRLGLIPYISENFGVDIVESTNRMADLARDDCNFLDEVVKEKYEECVISAAAEGAANTAGIESAAGTESAASAAGAANAANAASASSAGNTTCAANAAEAESMGNMASAAGVESAEIAASAAGAASAASAASATSVAGAAAAASAANMVELDVNKIIKCHSAIRKRVIRKAIEMVKGDLNSVESIHVEKAIDLCINGRTGSVIHLPHNIRAAKSYGVLKIYLAGNLSGEPGDSPGDLSNFNKRIEIPGITNIEMLDACLKAAVIKREEFDEKVFLNLSHDSLVQFFDYDRLKEGINIRGRESGDIFYPYKCKGTKKLKEFFIDTKIPREERSRVPLVAKGKDIVWVIGYKISDAYKITESTKNVLRLEFMEQ